jgi:hypothetical protein
VCNARVTWPPTVYATHGDDLLMCHTVCLASRGGQSMDARHVNCAIRPMVQGCCSRHCCSPDLHQGIAENTTTENDHGAGDLLCERTTPVAAMFCVQHLCAFAVLYASMRCVTHLCDIDVEQFA